MIINDLSLCNTGFSLKISTKNVHDYIVALFESGVDTVEIDLRISGLLAGIDTSERFIFRAENVSELCEAQKQRYAFISIPYEILSSTQSFVKNISNKDDLLIKTKYIVEVDVDRKSLKEIMRICEKLSNEPLVSMIRIVKTFNDYKDETIKFIDKYRDSLNTPLDICPLNIALGGLNPAYTAFKCKTDMISLCFGSPFLYTPYELFVLYCPIPFGASMAPLFAARLYSCAIRLNYLSLTPNNAIKNICDTLDAFKYGAVNVDFQKNEPNFLKGASFPNEPENVISKIQKYFFESNGIDPEIETEISGALDNFDMAFYNRFLKKGDFEN